MLPLEATGNGLVRDDSQVLAPQLLQHLAMSCSIQMSELPSDKREASIAEQRWPALKVRGKKRYTSRGEMEVKRWVH